MSGQTRLPAAPYLAEALGSESANAGARPVRPAYDEVRQERCPNTRPDVRPLHGRDRLATVVVAEGSETVGEPVEKPFDLLRGDDAVALAAADVEPDVAVVLSRKRDGARPRPVDTLQV